MTETDTETSTEQGRINRRQALKRIAAGGAVLWTIPAVQSLNMRHAMALGSPGEECYSIKLEPGKDCETPSANSNLPNAWRCLYDFDPDVIVTDQPTTEACSKVLNFTHPGNWFVTLAPGCHLEAGFSKCGSKGEFCTPSPSPEGSTGTIQFVPCNNGSGISHIEFTICCDPVP